MTIAIPALVATIKAHLEKAKESATKSEQHFISAGLRLQELKERKPGNVPWPQYVRKTFDLGQSRADELIRIANGTTTVAEVRANTAKRVQKHSKPMLANVGSRSNETTTAVVNERVGELGEFLFPWCTALERWIAKTQTSDADKECLIRFLHTGADELLQLAQKIDGR